MTLIMMLLGRTIFQKFGWKFAALVTPTVSLVNLNTSPFLFVTLVEIRSLTK